METGETFTMSRKEVPRAGLLKAALAGKISNAQGAQALQLSVRQFQRLKVRFKANGVRGLLHRLRGRPSARRVPAVVRARAATLLQTTYAEFNDCHATEKLREVEGVCLSRSAVRRLRRALGLPAKRRRRGRTVRTRRTPEAQLGALVQLDASPFPWLGDGGPMLALHGAVDDATGAGLALVLRPTEDLHGYVALLEQLCTRYGLPLALYGDRLNVFVRNDAHWTLDEQLRGAQDPTHFGRILRDLGIGFIPAGSPQAKGRIERFWQTLQDRLVAELRLHGITTVEGAHAFFPTFLADLTARFARTPTDARPPRPSRPPQLPLHARRRPRQYCPPWAPLGAAAAAPRLRRPPCRVARVLRRPLARVHGRALPRRTAGTQCRLRTPAAAPAQHVAAQLSACLSSPPSCGGTLSPSQSNPDVFPARPTRGDDTQAQPRTSVASFHAVLTPQEG